MRFEWFSCIWVLCNWDLRTMPRSSSEKKGHSSLTRVHIVRRNSNALFRNSATECNTFKIIFSETIFNETTSCQPAWADSFIIFYYQIFFLKYFSVKIFNETTSCRPAWADSCLWPAMFLVAQLSEPSISNLFLKCIFVQMFFNAFQIFSKKNYA